MIHSHCGALATGIFLHEGISFGKVSYIIIFSLEEQILEVNLLTCVPDQV